ncbi:RNA polymerase sigma factor SigF [Dactylosporangium sp. NBC_01737]|uniref:RNA polymerase sigma factor SigF n=1 Tax=Dactylosporangium sp. NBC_01737 TaxID=2975959 RepID=UPI002E12AB59|nr:RNA polymerase sigma factor SigF [Dactylosporangium sp. NBC_01737]
MTVTAHRPVAKSARRPAAKPTAPVAAPATAPVVAQCVEPVPAVRAPAPAPVPAPARGRVSHRDVEVEAQALLQLLPGLPAGSPSRERTRARLIELHLPLAEYLARRFRNRGEPLDDLVQVANVGLIKSVDGYDPSRGAAFTSYAIPMIVGELKRYFRDKGWDVRVPRRLQELRLEISKISGDLAQELGRSPTVADLAKKLGVSEEDVIEGIESGHAYRALSINAPANGEEAGAELADLLGGVDQDLEAVDDRESLRPIIAQLPEREQKIIAMRFFGNMTQTQIADRLDISQMHVSRLLAHALTHLRGALVTPL